MVCQKIFFASVFDDALREPVLERCSDLIWRPEQVDRGMSTIEDVCRELIRESRAFVAVLDWRDGRELAFADVRTPVTVLEIELIQALFQRMPIFIFALPRFADNERLQGLVDLADCWECATVWRVGAGDVSSNMSVADVVPRIQFIAKGDYCYRITVLWSALVSHFRRHSNLDIEFLNRGFDIFRDPFDLNETERLIHVAAANKDHASRLAMLWAAMRQLCAVPYNNDSCAHASHLWEKALREWVRSAGWYGLHDASPISLLAAVNSLIQIKKQDTERLAPDTSRSRVDSLRGGRASALYSMAKQSWHPSHRWKLLELGLQEAEAAIAARPHNFDGPLAVRGSIRRLRGQLLRAIRDHKGVVAFRRAHGASERGIGEALSELGWTYAWALRLFKARQLLAEGVALIRSAGISSPSEAGFFVRALGKYAMVQLLTLDIAGTRHTVAEARKIDQIYGVRDQMRGILRFGPSE